MSLSTFYSIVPVSSVGKSVTSRLDSTSSSFVANVRRGVGAMTLGGTTSFAIFSHRRSFSHDTAKYCGSGMLQGSLEICFTSHKQERREKHAAGVYKAEEGKLES